MPCLDNPDQNNSAVDTEVRRYLQAASSCDHRITSSWQVLCTCVMSIAVPVINFPSLLTHTCRVACGAGRME